MIKKGYTIMKIIKEFKEFISRGNAIELAIGVIIGTSFSSIVNSIVNDIITPSISLIMGDLDLTSYVWYPKEGSDIGITYGNFLQAVLYFLIVGFIIFLIVRTLNRFKKKQEVALEDPKPSQEVLLLSEILETLKQRSIHEEE